MPGTDLPPSRSVQPEHDCHGRDDRYRRRPINRRRAERHERQVREEFMGAKEMVERGVPRYDPDVEEKADPRFASITVPSHDGMTVFDALIYARITTDLLPIVCSLQRSGGGRTAY